MLYWGIILFICIIVFAISLKALNKSCWDSTLYLVSTLLTGIVAVIIALAMLLTTCEYRSFLASLENMLSLTLQSNGLMNAALGPIANIGTLKAMMLS